MKKFFDILILVAVSALFGQYTTEGQKYSAAIEQVRRQYIRAQTDYAQTHSTPYRWTLIDITQYPYWCANTPLSKDKGQVVTVSEKGATIRSIKNAKGVEHIMVPAMSYIDKTNTRTYRMYYFYADSTGTWVKDKEPTETVVGVSEDGSYFYCLK